MGFWIETLMGLVLFTVCEATFRESRLRSFCPTAGAPPKLIRCGKGTDPVLDLLSMIAEG
jgi:hypothetical protein